MKCKQTHNMEDLVLIEIEQTNKNQKVNDCFFGGVVWCFMLRVLKLIKYMSEARSFPLSPSQCVRGLIVAGYNVFSHTSSQVFLTKL